MKPRLRLLSIVGFASIAWAATNGYEVAFAQPPSEGSRSDSSGRDHERDRSRSRFGDRSRGDWRSSRSRGDEERRGEEGRSEERSSSNGSGSSSASSSGTSSSSRSTSSSTPAPSTSTSTSSSAAASGIDLKKWATALVAKNDKNGNMILEPDEQSALGSSAAGEDLNHDGRITIDEIVMHHSAGVTAASPPASGASTSSTSSASGRSSDSRPKSDDPMAKRVLTGTAGGTGKDADKRHSYRFSKPADKLPTGLPSFFSRDGNKDGQVSMSEFSRSVSESTVAEFRRYDANDDGMITAKEAAKKK